MDAIREERDQLRGAVSEAYADGRFVYGLMLAERWRLAPDREPGSDLYCTVLGAGERLLQDAAGGDAEAAAWAWTVMQEQVPALRTGAGLSGPSERERELRERYGVPEPLPAAS